MVNINKTIYLNWSILYNLNFKNIIYYHFYNKIKQNFNWQNFIEDLDFLSTKLIAICHYIEQKDNLHVLSMYFAILEDDIKYFLEKNIDISKFLIIENKEKELDLYLFLCNLNSKDKIINDEDLKNTNSETRDKINNLILNNKIKQLIGLYITVNDEDLNKIFTKSVIFNEKNNIYLIEYTYEAFFACIENLYETQLKNQTYIYKTQEGELKLNFLLLKDFYINYYIE